MNTKIINPDYKKVNSENCDRLVRLIALDHTLEINKSKWAVASQIQENKFEIETDLYFATVNYDCHILMNMKAVHMTLMKFDNNKVMEYIGGICHEEKNKALMMLEKLSLEINVEKAKDTTGGTGSPTQPRTL